jgi:hypothetical protein
MLDLDCWENVFNCLDILSLAMLRISMYLMWKSPMLYHVLVKTLRKTLSDHTIAALGGIDALLSR